MGRVSDQVQAWGVIVLCVSLPCLLVGTIFTTAGCDLTTFKVCPKYWIGTYTVRDVQLARGRTGDIAVLMDIGFPDDPPGVRVCQVRGCDNSASFHTAAQCGANLNGTSVSVRMPGCDDIDKDKGLTMAGVILLIVTAAMIGLWAVAAVLSWLCNTYTCLCIQRRCSLQQPLPSAPPVTVSTA
jgi:hypothetical protein